MVSLRMSAPPGKPSEARKERQMEGGRWKGGGRPGQGMTCNVKNACINRNNSVLIAITNCTHIFRDQAARN